MTFADALVTNATSTFKRLKARHHRTKETWQVLLPRYLRNLFEICVDRITVFSTRNNVQNRSFSTPRWRQLQAGLLRL